jgi:hypothetical protein
MEGEQGGTDESRAAAKVKATKIHGAQSVKNAETAREQARRDWRTADTLHDAQVRTVEGLEKYVENARRHL